MICLEDFREQEEITYLPCDHMFHTTCIWGWLQNQVGFKPTSYMNQTTVSWIFALKISVEYSQKWIKFYNLCTLKHGKKHIVYVSGPDQIIILSMDDRFQTNCPICRACALCGREDTFVVSFVLIEGHTVEIENNDTFRLIWRQLSPTHEEFG